jgi:hypothetical protein
LGVLDMAGTTLDLLYKDISQAPHKKRVTAI